MESNELFLNTDPLLSNHGSDNVIDVTDPFVLSQGTGISTKNVSTAPVGTPSTDLPIINAGKTTELLPTLALEQDLNRSNSSASDLPLKQNYNEKVSPSQDFLIGGTNDGLLVGDVVDDLLTGGIHNVTMSIQSLTTEQAPSNSPLSAFSLFVSDLGESNDTGTAIEQYPNTSNQIDGAVVDRLNDDQKTWEILETLRQEAIARWASLGIEQADLLQLKDVKFQLVDLTGDTLGLQSGQVITLDPDAAGSGWFIDVSPSDDLEFGHENSASEFQADDSDLAKGHVDLLTVIQHEMGHVLGLEHPEASNELNYLMSATLPLGVRRIPTVGELSFTHSNNLLNEAGDKLTLSSGVDLTVSDATAPARARLGQPFQVNWTVTNQSNVEALANWADSVYLSYDAFLDPTDQKLTNSSTTAPTPLTVNGKYTQQANVIIPYTTLTGNLFLLFVTDSNNNQTEDNENNNILAKEITLTSDNSLVNGLGGAAGFGENILSRNDDGSTGFVDITSVFESGLNFFGKIYKGFYINNNGNITFNSPSSTYTPFAITGNTGTPIIATFFTDVDTRAGSVTPSPGGSSTGSNLVYWDLDPENSCINIFWYNKGLFLFILKKFK